jgi:hypothetical protein
MGRPSTASRLIGRKFGRLLVTEDAGFNKQGRSRVACTCDCGNTIVVNTSNIIAKTGTRSCGCLSSEQARYNALNILPQCLTKHGKSGTRTHRIWRGMKTRCFNVNHPAYGDYGGRGITVCDQWKDSFEAFLSDMGECPEGHSIDRANNDGNYEPGNCRWASRSEQARNTRRNRIITYRGESKTLTEHAQDAGIPMKDLWARLESGWTIEDALETPIRRTGVTI